jgi:hypothetical protein
MHEQPGHEVSTSVLTANGRPLIPKHLHTALQWQDGDTTAMWQDNEVLVLRKVRLTALADEVHIENGNKKSQ